MYHIKIADNNYYWKNWTEQEKSEINKPEVWLVEISTNSFSEKKNEEDAKNEEIKCTYN